MATDLPSTTNPHDTHCYQWSELMDCCIGTDSTPCKALQITSYKMALSRSIAHACNLGDKLIQLKSDTNTRESLNVHNHYCKKMAGWQQQNWKTPTTHRVNRITK